jgi:hypothetical protein
MTKADELRALHARIVAGTGEDREALIAKEEVND